MLPVGKKKAGGGGGGCAGQEVQKPPDMAYMKELYGPKRRALRSDINVHAGPSEAGEMGAS